MSNSSRKATRSAKKQPVERIIPITIEDEGRVSSTSSESVRQVDAVQETRPEISNQVREVPVDVRVTRSLRMPGKQHNSTKAEGNESTSTGPVNSDSSEGNEICTSVKELVLSSGNDTDEEKIKEESISKCEVPQQLLPPYNVPEKIVLVLDRARDEMFTHFELNSGAKFEPLNMLKHSLAFFLHNKNVFDAKHEYALLVLNENSATWVHDFTADVNSIIDKFDDIDECETEDIFDLNSVFDLVGTKVNVPETKSDLLIPPPFTVRIVFVYGRSITMPEIQLSEEVSRCLGSPYFTFDVLMTHETPDSSNKCNLIFKKLQELDTKGFAYFFPVSRSCSELHHAVAKLLSHPLQRPHQKIANYKLTV